jgi:hypothetical protein
VAAKANEEIKIKIKYINRGLKAQRLSFQAS